MNPLLGAPLLMVSLGWLVVGALLLGRWRKWPWVRIPAGLVLVLVGCGGSGVGGYGLWFTHRGQPRPWSGPWYAGVDYERVVLQQPRHVVAHLVRIDLHSPGIGFLVTSGERSEAGDVFADKTSGFATRHGVQIAINANYFYPFHNTHPFHYEPRVGQAVRVVGAVASHGQRYGDARERNPTLYLSLDNRVSFEQPVGKPWHAVSGLGYVVRDGARAEFFEDEFTRVPYPRMIAGTDAEGRYLLLLAVDGKQPGYSEGLTLEEAADLLLQKGAHTAIQLDGGGSATLVKQEAPGRFAFVNIPVNFGVVWWERVVATHLGIYASDLAMGR